VNFRRQRPVHVLESPYVASRRAGATILVVDDEPALLGLVGTMLWRAGYQVLEASAPSEALRIYAEHPRP